MDKLEIKDREIVVPGDLLASGMTFLPSGRAFRDEDKIYASSVGITNVKGRVVKVIPLAGRYMPKSGDTVIGKIISISKMGWGLDIDAPYNADLNIGEATSSYIDLNRTELSRFFDIGDWVVAGVLKIAEGMYIKLTARDRQYHKLRGGNVIKVSPTKIPRIIGKAGSMISTLKKYTNCDVIVGQNGLVWINGDPEMIALTAKAIKKIEAESHTSGLTDRIKTMLEKSIKEVK